MCGNINVTGIRCTREQKRELKMLMEKHELNGAEVFKYLINIMLSDNIKKVPAQKICDTTFSCRTNDKFVFSLLYKEFREKYNANGGTLIELLLEYLR